MDDVRVRFLGLPHGTTPAAVTTNKNIKMSSFKSSHLSSDFPTRSDTNQAVQLHKIPRDLQFRIHENGWTDM